MKVDLKRYTTEPLPLPDSPTTGRRIHLFEPDDVDAVEVAMAAGRPLLLRGEPGVGKSQLADAVAAALGRPIAKKIIDSRTEARDLFFEVDFVERLNEAQMSAFGSRNRASRRRDIEIRRFTRPGALWWGFDRKSAIACGKATHGSESQAHAESGGTVILIDEIDKAESDVPNGLLVALGDGWFEGPDKVRVECRGQPPFIVITTNNERDLPDAFMRRCVVHNMAVPDGNPKSFFTRRGEVIYQECSLTVIEKAADDLLKDRSAAAALGERKPGLAEYLDLLRVLNGPEIQCAASEKGMSIESLQHDLLAKASRFIFRKFVRLRSASSESEA